MSSDNAAPRSRRPGLALPAVRIDEWLRSLQLGVLVGLAVLCLVLTPPPHASRDGARAIAPTTAPVRAARYADFGPHQPSRDARHVADWIADSSDNAGAEFMVLDKRGATLYVFDAQARLRDATPVLLGAARGDDNAPGIGTRAITDVLPHERTTPAGRFVAERGRNHTGETVVWVDYDAAVSMHRVRATEPSERRLQRLASLTIADNRVSYGCINVPPAFFDNFVLPTVDARRAVVYVLPEVRTLQQVFNTYDVAVRHGESGPPPAQPAS